MSARPTVCPNQRQRAIPSAPTPIARHSRGGASIEVTCPGETGPDLMLVFGGFPEEEVREEETLFDGADRFCAEAG